MDLVLEGTVKGQYVRIHLDRPALRVGRSQDADIRIDDATVSRSHAVLSVLDDHLELKDLGSHNGTFLNGKRLTDPSTVKPGDQIRIGSVLLTLLPTAAPTMGIQQIATILLPAETVRTVLQIPLEVIRDQRKTKIDPENLPTMIGSRLMDLVETAPEEADTYEGHLEVVTTALPRMIATQTPDEAIQTLPDLVQCMGPHRTLVLLLHDATGREMYLKAAWPPKVLEKRKTLLTAEILRVVMNERMSRMVERVGAGGADGAVQGGETWDAMDRVAFVAPLRVNEEPVGVLYVGRSDLEGDEARAALHAFNSLATLFAMKMAQCMEFERRLREHAQLQREKDRMTDAIAIAARIQKKLLPERLPDVAGYDIAADLWPSLETSGDLYDVLRLSPGRVGIVVGDASGKGLGAALLMANVLASLRMSFTESASLVEIVERLNAQLEQSTESDHFVTLFLGRLDTERHTLEYVNAGHIFPILFAPGSEASRLEATGIPAGLMAEARYGVETVEIPPGSLLCLYTDGMPEAARAGGP
ncbi:MAG TPA: SpoIIE family protein phosphatase, partial [Candidatus Eisenbacteria bacterium]|nr:SpoIIE family protein phosphatase [Candidatus Eisenbacteria bacterium]